MVVVNGMFPIAEANSGNACGTHHVERTATGDEIEDGRSSLKDIMENS